MKIKKLLSLIISVSLVLTIVPAGSFAVPATTIPQTVFNDYAKITSQTLYGSDTVVINIQDLHNNKEVQNNIYKLLESINKRYENVEVYMEGASQDVDFSKLSSIGSNNLSVLMESLFKNDKISGTEYFGYRNKKILKPVENKAVYDKNIQNYSILIKNKNEIQKLLLKEYMNLRTLNKYLTKEQKEILNIYNAYLNKRVSREKFCRYLYKQMKKRNIPDWQYPNSKLYHDVTKSGKKIKQKKVHSQLKSVLSDLKSSLNYQKYADFVKKSDNLSDINFVFSFLSSNISAADKAKYPDLFAMIKLREISSLINPLDLVEEDRQKVEDILLTESTTVKNKDIVFLNLFFEVYRKLLLAEISSKEYEYYKNNYDVYSDIYSRYLDDTSIDLFYFRRIAEEFNELNLERNKIFLSHLFSSSPQSFRRSPYIHTSIPPYLDFFSSAKNILVLVSGGFHTQGINELLDKNKISYITLTPNIKRNDYLYEQQYLKSIVQQADADFNAISKRPWIENPQSAVADIISSMNGILPSLLDSEQTTEKITEAVNKTIEEYSAGDFIKFNLDKDGNATIEIDGQIYILDYQSGEIKLADGTGVTTFAKNIKILIREALSNSYVRLALELSLDGYSGRDIDSLSPDQKAEKIFIEHNILFSDFANGFIKAIFDKIQNLDERSNDRVYEAFLKVKNSKGKNFQNAKIRVSSAKALIGSRPDGYGNIEEYGSLFYVVWKVDEKTGADVAEEMLISNELFKYLERFTDRQLILFFNDLFWHEDFERVALRGKNEKFNEYVFSNGLSLTSEVFHEYMKTPEFISFIRENGYSTDQIKLLEELDKIISEYNKSQSEYSDVLSLFSIDRQNEYSAKTIETFLSVRTGDVKVINSTVVNLAEKTYLQLEKSYIAEKRNIYPDYDINKDLDEKDFVRFLNKFVVVYRKSNAYMTPEKFADFIKSRVIKNFPQMAEYANKISIPAYEFKEFPKTKDGAKEEAKFVKEIKSKTVLIVEDIISKRSRTFNKIYTYLTEKGASRVQGIAIFDLSKETEEAKDMRKAEETETVSISNETFKRIQEEPEVLLKAIQNVNGNIKKYTAYWLAKLLQDSNGEKVLSQISNMDEDTVRNLLYAFFDILKNNDSVKNVENYEIINLILTIGFGRKINITELDKKDMDDFLSKYKFEIYREDFEPLEISYDDWKKDIPALIVYSYMAGRQFIRAVGVNDIDGTINNYNIPNRQLIETMCKKYSISFEDIKRKLKHSYDGQNTEKEDRAVTAIRQELITARAIFEKSIHSLIRKYKLNTEIMDEKQREEYLKSVEKIEKTYAEAVKKMMLKAKEITLARLAEQNIIIDDDLFLIMIGGSLAKGSMMSDSDVYYDIVVPDGTISKSIELRFAPLYSSILRQAGLTNYHVLKYSTTHMNKQNINTFVDEKEMVPFLNYEPLSGSEKKKSLYSRHIKSALDKSLETSQDTLDNLALINKRYRSVAQDGDGWMESSFLISYDDKNDRAFSTRSILMSLETNLNEMIFKYLKYLNDEGREEEFDQIFNLGETKNKKPMLVSIKDQINFIKENIIKDDEQEQAYMDSVLEAWQFLASCRYVNKNNSWSDFLPGERQAIETINDFVLRNTPIEYNPEIEDEKVEEIKNCGQLLSVIEDFVYDNSMDMEKFRNGYAKYAHLESWKQSADKSNEELFLFAQAVSLLMDIDSPQLRKKLRQLNIKGLDRYLDRIFDSIEAIKFIDEKFPVYSNIDGERSIQNYWDAVAKKTGNEETMLALIAHKLNKAQVTKEKEDEYLLYAVYLPLAKRFGNAEMYEYVRNDLFEYSHPGAYLNLLKIIKLLYGRDYSEISEYSKGSSSGITEFLKEKKIASDDFHINYRVKSLYSIYEKLNSSRKTESDDLKPLEERDINAIKYILNNKDITIFDEILRETYPEKYISVNTIKYEILSYIDEDFNALTDEQKKQLNRILAKMKNSIFYDHNVVQYIMEEMTPLIKDKFDISNGLDTKKLKETLKERESFFVLWFLELFENNLKDFVGLHVIVEDDVYDDVVTAIESQSENGSKYSALIDFFEQNKIFYFKKFERDAGNKQSREKFNALIQTEAFPLPSEICFYKKTNHEEETYGIYNFNKISAPHYIYKMGRNFVSSLFEHIYAKTMDYSFLNSHEDESFYDEQEEQNVSEEKNMIFVSDNFVPGPSFADNFDEVLSNLEEMITCFVEYEGKVYVQKMPQDACIFDLAVGKYFSDDTDVSVYNENGEPLTSNLVLQDSRRYKIIKGYDRIAVPSSEDDIFTIRGKLIYKGERARKSYISNIIKQIGSSSYISYLTSLILDNAKYANLIDESNIPSLKLAELIYSENAENAEFKKYIKDEEKFKEDFVSFLKVLLNFRLEYKLINKNISGILRRSVQIASHYNLADVLELFEALDYGIIDFDDIESFYGTFVYIKTKSKNYSAQSIAEQIKKAGFKMRESDYNYNLVINDVKYRVENAKKYDFDFMRDLISIESLGLVAVPDKNDERVSKDKNSIFITIDFIMPEEPFSLMSLGKNVEQLVKNYAVSHPDMVRRILSMTERIAYSGEVFSQEEINSLMDEYPVLMTQILLGMYSEDGSAVLSEETPFLTQEETSLLKTELQDGLSQNGISVSDIKLAVSKSLDLAESEDSYSFATLDVSDGTATLFVSEAFLRMLDKLPVNEKEYFLQQLVRHETEEYKALQNNPDMNYEYFHKQIAQDEGQKNLMDKAASVAFDVAKMRVALINVVNTLENLKVDNNAGSKNIENIFWNMNIVKNDITGALHNFTEVLAYTLNGDIIPVVYDNKGLNNISLEDLKDIIFLLSVANAEEKAKIFVVFEQLAKTNESFRTVEGVLSLLENYVDKDSGHFMLLSEIIKYLYSDTSLQRPVANIEPVLPEPSADLGELSDITSLDEQTSKIHRLLSAA